MLTEAFDIDHELRQRPPTKFMSSLYSRPGKPFFPSYPIPRIDGSIYPPSQEAFGPRTRKYLAALHETTSTPQTSPEPDPPQLTTTMEVNQPKEALIEPVISPITITEPQPIKFININRKSRKKPRSRHPENVQKARYIIVGATIWAVAMLSFYIIGGRP